MDLSVLTPHSLHTYLMRTGWKEETDLKIHPKLAAKIRVYSRGTAVIDVPRHMHWADYCRRVQEALTIVGEVEGRPTPAEQVALSVLSDFDIT